MKRVADYEGSDYEGNFWRREGRDYEDRVERIAMRRLLPRGRRLLELGSGYGRLTYLYRNFEQVVLVDFSVDHLKKARARYGDQGHIYVAADIYHLPFNPGQFDVATMVRTIHHMEDPLAALKQARSAMQKGGTFILEFTNKHNLKMMAKWMACRVPAVRKRWGATAFDPFSREPSEFYSMYYGFHPDYVSNILRRAGFLPGGRLAVSYLRLPALKRILPTGLLVRLDALLQGTGDRWQFSPNVFVRARAVGEDETPPSSGLWRCPTCRGTDLRSVDEGLLCDGCHHMWPLKDGVYDFRAAIEPEKRVQVAATFGW